MEEESGSDTYVSTEDVALLRGGHVHVFPGVGAADGGDGRAAGGGHAEGVHGTHTTCGVQMNIFNCAIYCRDLQTQGIFCRQNITW